MNDQQRRVMDIYDRHGWDYGGTNGNGDVAINNRVSGEMAVISKQGFVYPTTPKAAPNQTQR